jgi:hypothetical protein
MPGISDIDSFIERAEELIVGGEHDSTLPNAALPLVFVRLVFVLSCRSIYMCHDAFVTVSYSRSVQVMRLRLLNVTACQRNA